MRTIIKSIPESNGAYTNQSWYEDVVPEGYIAIPDELLPIWEKYKPFVVLTIEDGVITAISDSTEARTAASAPTIDELRAEALARINGKCSEAIYSGVTVASKHYSLTTTAQSNLKTAQDKAKAGDTAIPYSADGEELTAYTAAEIISIAKAADDWGTVNIAYYGKLKKWIARETDKNVMTGIHYSSALPDDLNAGLTALLKEFGMNLSDYSNLILK